MSSLTFTGADLAILLPNVTDEERDVMAKDALARALLAAPCLTRDDLTELQIQMAQAIIRGAVERWALQTNAALAQTVTAGEYTLAPAKPGERKSMYWDSEMDDLRKICAPTARRRAQSRWVI